MDLLQPTSAACPYCGEPVELVVDRSAGEQSYIEDCVVCCRPIQVEVTVPMSGEPARVVVRHEDDA